MVTSLACGSDDNHQRQSHQSTNTAPVTTDIHNGPSNWQLQQPASTSAVTTSTHNSHSNSQLMQPASTAPATTGIHNSHGNCQPQLPAPAAAATTRILKCHGKRRSSKPGQQVSTAEWKQSSSVAVTTSIHHSHCNWQPGQPASTPAMAASTYNCHFNQH